MKILFAEDSKTEALKAKYILEKQGYQVYQVENGQELLEAAHREQPDLIVMDTIMPRMTGYEAYQLLKVSPQTGNIPVLMLMTNNGPVTEPLPLGQDTYIAKPYSPELLINGVQTAATPGKNGNGSAANGSGSAGGGNQENFMAMMSHELRTPLHELMGMTDLLRHTGLTPEQEKYVNQARVSISGLTAMVGDILEFAELEKGQLDLQTGAFDFRELLQKIIETMRFRAEEKGLDLSLTIADDLPPGFIGDAKRLRQVLSNLISNGIKFTEKGSISVAVKVAEAGKEQAAFTVSVKDTGVGIPKDRQAQIFAAFQQADLSNTRKHGGIGLGLAVASKLLALMESDLTVFSSGVSEEGSEFKFTLTLPIDPDAVRQEPDRGPLVVQKGMRVLLAEDSPTNQLIARANLTKAGFEIEVAENGRIAVEKFQSGEYDFVLMDVAMPEMDGLEATQTIRQLEAAAGNGVHIPIIAMTAFTMKGYREKCLDAGMDGYVSKPISAEELFQSLNEILHSLQTNTEEAPPAEPVVSLEKALGIVDNDLDILEMVVDMLPMEYPDLVAAIDDALAAADPAQLEPPAHRLKTVLGSVGGSHAFDLAQQLETMGVTGELDGGIEVVGQLKPEIARILAFYERDEWLDEAAALLGEDDG